VHGKSVAYFPNGVINDEGPYEFIIPNESNEMTSLQDITIYGEVEVEKKDKTAWVEADLVTLPNNWPQALFSQIEVYLNNQCVNDLSTPTYPYKAYLENMLSFSDKIKTGTLNPLEKWEREPNGQETSLTDNMKLATHPWKKRSTELKKRMFFEIIPHIDFLRSDKYLIPGVELKIRLIKAANNFTLIMNGDNKAVIKIKKLELKTRKVTVVNNIILDCEKTMETVPAMYHIAHSKIKSHLITAGVKNPTVGHLFRGKLPRSFLITFCESTSFDGHHEANPFVFPHCDLNFFQVIINGEPLHARALQFDFTDGSAITHYKWFLDNSGQKYEYHTGVSFENFCKNTFFLCYDLSPDQCNGHYKHIVDNGTVDLLIGFKEALTKNITMMSYATFNETVAIDKNRNITITSV
jgi:hypothetical protein